MGNAESLSADKKMLMRLQGVTYGPIFSREIDAAAFEVKNTYLKGLTSLDGAEQIEFFSKIIETGRLAGADIDKWFQARTFDAVSGPMAEAIFSKREFCEIWNGYEAENDMSSVVRDAHISKIGSDVLHGTINRMSLLSARMMEQPKVWSAVLTLAKQLPAMGTMAGARAVAIIGSVLPGPDIHEMFANGVKGLSELQPLPGFAPRRNKELS